LNRQTFFYIRLVINLFAGQNEFTLILISFIPGSSRIESNERFIVLPLTVTTSSAENPEQFRHADGSSIFPIEKIVCDIETQEETGIFAKLQTGGKNQV
jgi:hypothetical protein